MIRNIEAELQTIIPTRIISGLNVVFNDKKSEKEIIDFPLSTYETPLFASVSRGVKVSNKCPISVVVLSSCMTRSVVFQCKNLLDVQKSLDLLEKVSSKFQDIVAKTSKHCKFQNFEKWVVGTLLYVRFSYDVSEASGHNMTTIATNEIAKFFVEEVKNAGIFIEYISNSANVCCDKKVSAVNHVCGRGKNVIAEMIVDKKTCEEILHTTPEKIVNLNIKKNLIGSIIGGSICSANAHYANMLAGMFLPLGQDIANIVEGSQGITYCNLTDDGDLYFSVNLPNIICGCVGNGKNLDFVVENLKMIGCRDGEGKVIEQASERMAGIIGAVVLCGELSLMSALTNQDELVKSHLALERGTRNR